MPSGKVNSSSASMTSCLFWDNVDPETEWNVKVGSVELSEHDYRPRQRGCRSIRYTLPEDVSLQGYLVGSS